MDSPGREASPKRSNPNVMSHPDKPRLHNDNGQVRLTAKMRDKEKELRRFLAQ